MNNRISNAFGRLLVLVLTLTILLSSLTSCEFITVFDKVADGRDEIQSNIDASSDLNHEYVYDYLRDWGMPVFDKAKFKYTKAPMYTSAPKDLTKFNLDNFDCIALFSPIGVRSLVKSFPDIKDRHITIAAFGTSTHAALKEQGIKLTIAAPTQSAPSMAMAIENYILGKEQDAVIASKGDNSKHSTKSSASASPKKVKPVIANKEIYKQRMEEKKAQAAARRAARAEARAKMEKEEKNEKTIKTAEKVVKTEKTAKTEKTPKVEKAPKAEKTAKKATTAKAAKATTTKTAKTKGATAKSEKGESKK